MARRKDGILETLTQLPWWGSVLISCAVYIVMRWVLPSIEFESLYLVGLATAAPQVAWFFALIFLFPGLVSFLKRKQRRLLLDTRSDLESIRKLSWSDFELLIAEAFRRQGYVVEEHGGSAPDGGVDLVVGKGGAKTLVQCKHWKSQKVGVSIVRELLGVITAKSASAGIVVTAGDYTADARTFARDNRVRLINGAELVKMIDASKNVSNRKAPLAQPGGKQASLKCPACGGAMLKRVAKRGASVGQAFWGCSAFPKCRGIRPV